MTIERVVRIRTVGNVMCAMLIVLLLLTMFVCPAFAHRPVVVKNRSSKDAPVTVAEPEISWAFYGELNGEPHYYKIVSDKPFDFYVNILVPDLDPKGPAVEKHDMSFEIYREGEEEMPIFTADGLLGVWRRFYEKYGRDNYYMGPEYDAQTGEGTYYVQVFNGPNAGRYALAIGKREKFTFFSFIGAIVKAWSLDRWFFK